MPNHATATDQQVTALVDFGSTFTKVAVVDIETGDLLSSGQSTTTVHTDVLEGLAAAFTSCRPELGAVADLARRCCSSAGGGLRMVVLGLEEDITTQAARQVALNPLQPLIQVALVPARNLHAPDAQWLGDVLVLGVAALQQEGGDPESPDNPASQDHRTHRG